MDAPVGEQECLDEDCYCEQFTKPEEDTEE